MNNKNKIIIITISVILIVIIILTTILHFNNNELFKVEKYINDNYEVELISIIDEYNELENEGLIYYIDLLNLITDSFTEEEALDIVSNYNEVNVNVFYKLKVILKYIKYSENNNTNSEIKIDDLDLQLVVPCIYELDRRLDSYSNDEISKYIDSIETLIAIENINDISISSTKELCNLIGVLVYDLPNTNYILSIILNVKQISELDEVLNLLFYGFKYLTSEDVLELIDVVRTTTEDTLIFILTYFYDKSYSFNTSLLKEELNIIITYFNINLDVNIYDLALYLKDNNVIKYNDIYDSIMKEEIDKIILKINI